MQSFQASHSTFLQFSSYAPVAETLFAMIPLSLSEVVIMNNQRAKVKPKNSKAKVKRIQKMQNSILKKIYQIIYNLKLSQSV
ncbi:hypothetical protein FGO68_gene4375 [Halteria grandinella]|uniref:Uncharacterized protein n=1 Tax=Halteria grandinella TaxID=5974 RepID=A0A8J8NMF1_HALGN|nr:hypothetical protein FGO68_gene4375 [Halteria grandinella]